MVIFKRIQHLLPEFFVEFPDKHVMSISEDRGGSAIAFFIFDPSIPGKLLISVCADYPDSVSTTKLVIAASQCSPVAFAEPFYISHTSGETYWGEAAYTRWELESIDLSQPRQNSEPLH